MRPNISGSLRRIALGVMLPTMLTSAGCYHSTMYPGYGAPMYGNPAPGYGGYQGIQTLTPGTYYAPGTAPTFNSNGLTPQADPNASGSSSGSGGQGSGGSNAPPYSPPTSNENPSRPVPMYDSGAGGDGSAPQDDPSAEPQLNQNDSGSPSTLSKPAANEEWAIKPASGNDDSELESQEPTESVESPATEPSLDPVESGVDEEEEPSLLAPPLLEEQEPVKP